MPWLKFYRVERSYNADLYELKIHKRQAQNLVNKLSRHFKFRKIEVLNNARSSGHAYWRYIDIPRITSVGMVIHEAAHIWNNTRFGGMKHNKKLHTAIKRLSAYFHKHLTSQFTSLELPKPKLQKTPVEKYQIKLKNTKASVKRLTTRIKMLTTRLRTAKKRQTYFQKQIRRLG